ncbi:hypothetical protein HAX54_016972, partial [Datura stramonium]|nr:hypothetical protein [Datura stramonium]
YCEIEVQGDELGTTTIGDSPIGSSETLMEHRFRLILASGHCLDQALHRRFVDQDWRFSSLSLIEYKLPQFSISHRRFSGGLQIPFFGLP